MDSIAGNALRNPTVPTLKDSPIPRKSHALVHKG